MPSPSRLVQTPMPSLEDYYKGMNQIRSWENYIGKKAVPGAGGQFYYGAAPEKVPQGSLVLRGPDLKRPMRDRNRGSYHIPLETYQVIPGGMAGGLPAGMGGMAGGVAQALGTAMQQGPTLDLTRSGRGNVFNTGDLKYAREQGMTRKEIRKAAEAQGVRLSAKAKARLYKKKKERG